MLVNNMVILLDYLDPYPIIFFKMNLLTFVNGLGSAQSNTTLLRSVSAKHIRSISLLKLSSSIVYFGMYIGSKGSL